MSRTRTSRSSGSCGRAYRRNCTTSRSSLCSSFRAMRENSTSGLSAAARDSIISSAPPIDASGCRISCASPAATSPSGLQSIRSAEVLVRFTQLPVRDLQRCRRLLVAFRDVPLRGGQQSHDDSHRVEYDQFRVPAGLLLHARCPGRPDMRDVHDRCSHRDQQSAGHAVPVGAQNNRQVVETLEYFVPHDVRRTRPVVEG